MRTDPLIHVSRRSFLTTAGGVAAGLQLAALSGTARAGTALPPLPWGKYYPSTGLDPEAVRKAGFVLYYKEGGCGQGSAQAILDALAAKVPEPFALLPRGMFAYGAGGVVGWGTVCGAVNGAMAAFDILGVHNQLGNALMDYLCNTALPTDKLIGYVPPTGVPKPMATFTQSVSKSPLCHSSVSKWAQAATANVNGAEKKDRCARVVGDVVAYAVQLLNDKFTSNIVPPAWVPPENYLGCYECHSTPDMLPSQQGKADCLSCHEVTEDHGRWRQRRGF